MRLRVRRFARRLVRALRLLAGDKRIPRPLRWGLTLGLLPVPGPFDEAVLVVVALPLLVFHRARLMDAWVRAGRDVGGAAGP